MQAIQEKELGIGTELKNKIIQTYPEYIKQFPNYIKVLDISEYLMNKVSYTHNDFNKYDQEIIYAIENEQEMTIVLNPEKSATFLSWNSDYYFDRYFIKNMDFLEKRSLVLTLETLANVSANLKLYFAEKVHQYIYQKVGYNVSSFIDALKMKRTFPVTQLLNRVRDYFQIPVIEFKDNEDGLSVDKEIIKEKVMNKPNDPEVKELMGRIQTFESKTGIKLSTDEKIDFITEKIVEKLITDDYDEIES